MSEETDRSTDHPVGWGKPNRYYLDLEVDLSRSLQRRLFFFAALFL